MSDKKRLIPDAECAQSKCACTTTGCWGECSLKRNPIVYANSANIVAAQHAATHPATIPAPNVKDMSLLIARLSYALKKAAPEHELPAKATAYLQKHDLIGSPLRAEASTYNKPERGLT